MSEKHIGKVIQVIGPVLDIQFKDGELPSYSESRMALKSKAHRDVAVLSSV